MEKNDNMTYEEAAKRLEDIVKELENGKKTLDESVKLFEEGARLAKYCNDLLKCAEQKIIELSEAGEKDE